LSVFVLTVRTFEDGGAMSYYGYNRVSTKQQHLDRGDASIKAFCEERGYPLIKIYSDKQTGRNFDRARYVVLKEDVLREGDVLIVSELDRIGRTKSDILKELVDLKALGVRVMFLDIPTTLIDFSGKGDDIAKLLFETVNNLLIEMFATFAQAEVERKDKRRAEGIAAMKGRGEWDKYGRPRTISKERFAAEYEKVERGEIKPIVLIKQLGIREQTYYRYRKEYLDARKGNEDERKTRGKT
jgi:DNA invertase Pin-like site-specific DNA recombinase